MASNPRPPVSPLLRMAIDLGPLILFFVTYAFAPGPSDLGRLFTATAAFMVAISAAMAVSYWKTRHISPMLWISGAMVLVMGGLTLYFHDATFIKMKPTFYYVGFAIVLGFGLATGKPLLQQLLETSYPGLSPRGWQLMTINWTVFFLVMAVLNEVVWRTTSTGTWVTFKVWGGVGLGLLFAGLNIPILMRHGLDEAQAEDIAKPPEG